MSELHRVHVSIPTEINIELWCSSCGGPLEFYWEHDEQGNDDPVRELIKVEPCSHCLNRAIADLVEAGEIKIEGGKIRRIK